jgi:hypothetical protein
MWCDNANQEGGQQGTSGYVLNLLDLGGILAPSARATAASALRTRLAAFSASSRAFA